MMFFFVWVIWLFLLFKVVIDIFRSDDLGGFSKALWLLFVIFAPYLGVFVYLIARGHKMTERDIAQRRGAEGQHGRVRPQRGGLWWRWRGQRAGEASATSRTGASSRRRSSISRRQSCSRAAARRPPAYGRASLLGPR